MSFLSRYVFKSKLKRIVFFLFDLLGSLLFYIPAQFNRRISLSSIRKILAIRLDQIGDVGMLRPALHQLKARFPRVEIDILVSQESAALLHDSPEIHHILTMRDTWFSASSFFQQLREAFHVLQRVRKEKYDVAIDFRGDFRNILLMYASGIPHRLGLGITGGHFLLTHPARHQKQNHQVLQNIQLLESLDVTPDIVRTPFTYSESRKESFRNTLPEDFMNSQTPRILIHPGAAYESKRWPAPKFRELLRQILAQNLGTIILIGTQKEKALFDPGVTDPRLIDLRGKTRLDDLPVLFDTCHLYIGNDSGPSHIAAAQGLALIILFSGTNDPAVWHPWTERLAMICHQVPCSPCESRQCPLKHHDCMEKIDVSEVMSRIDFFLKEASFP